MYPESVLEEIRNRTDIVELLGEYLTLKKSGSGFVGLCPFHGEKTPSFHVHPVRQCFHCFGCHKGGNIFTFLMAFENFSFPEAVQKLARRAGVTLQNEEWKPKQNAVSSHREIAACLEWAAKYFHYLLCESKNYASARSYLTKRGITTKTIEKFMLGVSPKGQQTLLEQMQKRKFGINQLVEAGLIIQSEKNAQHYDRFRHRLMFPIRDRDGNTLGFGGRLLAPDENKPKYLNSPESPLFSKRTLLYGQFENEREIRRKGEALIVEGYMDVIGLHEKGVTNAVATMGTALTAEHCEQIKGMTQKVVTIFDTDRAGRDAWQRSVHLFLSAGLFAKDLTLPEGKDPDEYVMAEGAEKFSHLCSGAPKQITKLLKEIAAKGKLSEEQRATVLSELTPILLTTRKSAEHALLWDSISLVLGITVDSLRAWIETTAKNHRPAQQPPPLAHPSAPQKSPAKSTHKRDRFGLELFEAAIQCPKDFLKLDRSAWEGCLADKRIEGWLIKMHEAQSGPAMEKVLEELAQTEADPDLLSRASQRLIGPDPKQADPKQPDPKQPNPKQPAPKPNQEYFQEVIKRACELRREKEVRRLTTQVKLTGMLGDEEEQLRLLERMKALRSQ
ncbi:MAG: DNA primase [Deltaproteobacteria bacterium]|nr:DNA primase [Deltaproteobacteria bacterium]